MHFGNQINFLLASRIFCEILCWSCNQSLSPRLSKPKLKRRCSASECSHFRINPMLLIISRFHKSFIMISQTIQEVSRWQINRHTHPQTLLKTIPPSLRYRFTGGVRLISGCTDAAENWTVEFCTQFTSTKFPNRGLCLRNWHQSNLKFHCSQQASVASHRHKMFVFSVCFIVCVWVCLWVWLCLYVILIAAERWIKLYKNPMCPNIVLLRLIDPPVICRLVSLFRWRSELCTILHPIFLKFPSSETWTPVGEGRLPPYDTRPSSLVLRFMSPVFSISLRQCHQQQEQQKQCAVLRHSRV